MLKFLKRIGNKWWLYIFIVLFTIFQVVCDFLIPLMLGAIIAKLQAGEFGSGDIVYYSILMAIAALISGVSAILVGKFGSSATSYIIANLRSEIFKKISSFSSEEMNKFSASSLLTRTTNDLTNISNTYNIMFRFVLYGPLMTIAAFVYLLTSALKAWQLILCVLAAVILLILSLYVLCKIVLPKFRAIQGKFDRVNLVTKENLEGLRVVRAYNAEDYQKEKFEKINEDLMITDRFANTGINALFPVIQVVVGILLVATAWISAPLIDGGAITYAEMTVVSQLSILLLLGFIMMAFIFVQLPRSIICARRVNEVLEQPFSIVSSTKNGHGNEIGSIEFRNVTFKYPGADVPAVKNVSFKVTQGQTIAFIGATGAGKTSILNLIPRFYDATEGEVLVDGVNVKDYKLDNLLAKFGYVPQKAYLFHASLRDNVCLGVPGATDEQFQRALDISQSSEFVSKLKGQGDFEISQGGKNVSGGQRQRLSIARAIIMDPEIFLFDDSFSALDYKTDKVLRGEIKKQCKKATSVIVAQRVGTIMDADIIVCIDNGAVAGIGTHKELLKNCAVYKEIALSQLSKEELEK